MRKTRTPNTLEREIAQLRARLLGSDDDGAACIHRAAVGVAIFKDGSIKCFPDVQPCFCGKPQGVHSLDFVDREPGAGEWEILERNGLVPQSEFLKTYASPEVSIFDMVAGVGLSQEHDPDELDAERETDA